MLLEQLLDLPKYILPTVNTSGKSFITFYKNLITDYIDAVKKSTSLLPTDVSVILSHPELIDQITFYGTKIIEVLRCSLRGNQEEAYSIFSTMMKDAYPIICNYNGAVHFTKKEDIFFRCRNIKDRIIRPAPFFFHTPFELGYRVKSTRFSAPGIPSMYLSNSLIVGYKELRAENPMHIQAVKYQQALGSLAFIDLDYTKPDAALLLSNRNKYYDLLQIKGIIFPILLACYAKQDDANAVMPPEYAIPQLLRRWVEENFSIYSGIRYLSTRVTNPNNKGRFYNYILPAVDWKVEGYSNALMSKLHMSMVCAAYNDSTTIIDYYNQNRPTVINTAIETVEWGGLPVPYHQTMIGQMEYYMTQQLPVSKIII